MNDRAADLSARLDDLEIRIAHQDAMLADLNEVITAQAGTIAALERLFERLREEMQNIETPRGAPEPPPPHY